MSDNTAQAPLGTGFGYATTAEDVLRAVDLTGKRALVTEGYSGIGLETTRSLVAAGASVLVPARRPDLAREELAGLAGVEVGERWQAYGQSKTANALFAVHLDGLARERGVRAFALHPGVIVTNLGRHLSERELRNAGAIDEHGTPVINDRFKSPQQGAATQVWAATSPQLNDLGGLYLQDCDVAQIADDDHPNGDVKQWAVDPSEAERLWTWSARQTGAYAFA